jgi:hypothetical protein
MVILPYIENNHLTIYILKSEDMKTGFVIAAALIIVAAASLGIQNAMAKGIPWQAGYDHGCSDAKLIFSARYINQLSKGPSFHIQEFMSGYNAGFSACSSSEFSPVASNTGDGSSSSSVQTRIRKWSIRCTKGC